MEAAVIRSVSVVRRLPVEMIFFRRGDGTQIPAFLFKIRRQMSDAILFCQMFSDLIDPLSVFVRTDGEGGGKVIGVKFRRLFCGLPHSKFITVIAALSPLRQIFHTLCHRKETGRIIIPFQKSNLSAGFVSRLLYKTRQFMNPFLILLFLCDIRVVKK